MTGYLGTTARMVAVAPTSAQSESTPQRFSIQEARAKRWAFDNFRGGGMPREWAITIPAVTGPQMAVLDEFVQGAWGPGPFRWVSCAAHDTNVLTPSQSALADLDAASGMDTVDGYAPRSVLGPSATLLAERVPVIPGQAMTVSVDVSGAATLTAVLGSGRGGVVSTLTATATGTLAQRLTLSTPAVPATARTVDVEVSGHIRAARPQVTWTAEARPWAPGRGADSVVIQQGALDPIVINRQGGYWAGSVSLVEVG